MEPIIAFFVIESISMVVGIRGSGGMKFPKLGKIRQVLGRISFSSPTGLLTTFPRKSIFVVF